MKRIISTLLALMVAFGAASGQTGDGKAAAKASAVNAPAAKAPATAVKKRQSNPDAHRLAPSYGPGKLRIAVFGGSLSVNRESDAAKRLWAEALDAEVTTYGVGGAGFAISKGYSIQRQVDTAGVYDIYVLWASTNDFAGDRECGSWKDYTELDGYDPTRLDTQCGGINYCIRQIREKAPSARIVFFTSLRFFRRESGYNPFSEDVNRTGVSFSGYVRAQIECCRYHGVPVLDQFSLQDIDIHNYESFYKPDKLHMTEDGYRRIAPLQISFLSQFK